MTRRILLRAALLLAATGCTRAGTLPLPSPPTGPVAVPGVHPGFDTSLYPGEAAMRAWWGSSPYRWVGYYLASPCHRDASWMGARPALQRIGWGTAILYVGQQAFEGAAPNDTLPPERIVCSNTLLTAERGRADARDAVAKAAAEGFPAGSTLFLDVERMQQLPPAMVIYYQAWQDEVLRDLRYRPGTYAHRLNAGELYALAQTAYLRAGRRDAPPFWVSGGAGFGLERPPAGSGFPFATVWQGALDTHRTHGGVTLRIDENVATLPSPSAP